MNVRGDKRSLRRAFVDVRAAKFITGVHADLVRENKWQTSPETDVFVRTGKSRLKVEHVNVREDTSATAMHVKDAREASW